ncbi:MAG: hypothetical protein U9Q82_05915, partial [Chloroflexota bacterium]|nr:hypothetical protein [Chloroflexota bacterium]
ELKQKILRHSGAKGLFALFPFQEHKARTNLRGTTLFTLGVESTNVKRHSGSLYRAKPAIS